MLYIITYATHSERYFDILKDHPEIIVLGWGKKWEGFHNKVWATVEFCKSKSPDDIVCFVDGFDSVILSNKNELLNKYKKIGKPLIMSEDMNSQYVIVKFAQDKVFGKCKNIRLNSGMYIGTCESIINFWENFPRMEDDQTFATKKCRIVDYLHIDTQQDLFFNYTSNDSIHFQKNRITVNNKGSPCVISAPANQNINHILKRTGYTVLPEIKIDFYYRISTYFKELQMELYLILIILCIAYFIPDKGIAFKICILLFSIYLEYELFTKHLDLPFYKKVLYTLLDGFHIILFLFVFYLMFNLNCNIYKLIGLNSIFFISLFFYTIFKKSALTSLGNHIIGTQQREWISPENRLAYFSHTTIPYETSHSWMDGNRVFISLLAILNIYCLFHIYQKKKCNT